ncbi:MAG: ferric reductase-like transmembrane domain-containing protein [Candidatus Pacebacteria bacterium]|nr:ferric reductase-like transmembrane domain-containing protein [Candidatus Paceibacterota bacterium]
MKQLYLLLSKNQKKIKLLFLLSYISIIIMYVMSIWGYERFDLIKNISGELGEKFGQITIVLLTATLIPGMLKRFGILKRLSSILILFRRQLGVLSFFTAIAHMGFNFSIPYIASGTNFIPDLLKNYLTGFAAITIFFLLWVTSNDFSMKFMGKWWKYLQRLSYLAILLLILHTLDAGSKFSLVLGGVLSLEVLSWIYYFKKSRNQTVSIIASN